MVGGQTGIFVWLGKVTTILNAPSKTIKLQNSTKAERVKAMASAEKIITDNGWSKSTKVACCVLKQRDHSFFISDQEGD